MERDLDSLSLKEFLSKYPAAIDFLISYKLTDLDLDLKFIDALERYESETLNEMGLNAFDIYDLLLSFLSSGSSRLDTIKEIEIVGGRDKNSRPENIDLKCYLGDIISIVGPTGSGKSQLLADIECAARGDTPTGRHVLFDGQELSDEYRFSNGNSLVAQLTQNMNFVIDVSVKDFLTMHIGSRMEKTRSSLMEECFEIANDLSGEPFDIETKVTRLSGGQARALMIADAAFISPSPILLIDEIENAGIDRIKALDLLTKGNKIVLLATHDPLLALSASKRIILNNGAITSVMIPSDDEIEILSMLKAQDIVNTKLRNDLRRGITLHVGNV